MRHALRDLQGVAIQYLAAPDNIGTMALAVAINEAQQWLWLTIREQFAATTETIGHLDLEADRVVYELPDDVFALKRLYRLDDGERALRVFFVPREMPEVADWPLAPVPREPSPYEAEALGERRFRLLQTPGASVEKGMRLHYVPRPLPLAHPEDVSVLPEELHEILAVEAVGRLEAKGAPLLNPQGFQRALIDARRALNGYLTPSQTEGGDSYLVPNDFYSEAF